jgi:adenylate cyclase
VRAHLKSPVLSWPVVPWNGKPTIDESIARVARFDNDRKDADSSPGRVIPRPEDIAIGETKRFELAILHVDINNYKALAGQMNFRGAARFLSVYLTEMTYQIKEFGGDLESYGGDRVTALFGAGTDKTTAVENCASCAMTMNTVVQYVISPYLNRIGLTAFRVATGMDYGGTWIERVGVRDDTRLTLVGPTVSIASQLQEMAGPNQMLVGHYFYTGMSQKRQGFCTKMTSESWNWNMGDSAKTPYPFYDFRAVWTGYPEIS